VFLGWIVIEIFFSLWKFLWPVFVVLFILWLLHMLVM
jgi:hypothetical protein